MDLANSVFILLKSPFLPSDVISESSEVEKDHLLPGKISLSLQGAVSPGCDG